jgi:hypothetical protein
MGSGLGDPPDHRRARDRLAEAALAVDDQQRSPVEDRDRHLAGLAGAGPQATEIARQVAHAVAVMALEVRLDQVVGDDAGFLLRTAGGSEQRPAEAL